MNGVERDIMGGETRLMGEIGFDNVIETPFRNGKQELVILFPMVMHRISHSLLVIPIPTLNTVKKSKYAILLLKSKQMRLKETELEEKWD